MGKLTAGVSEYQRYKTTHIRNRLKNREKRRLQSKEWHLLNKERDIEYRKEYRLAHKAEALNRIKIYRQTEIGKASHRKEAKKYYYKNRDKILNYIVSEKGRRVRLNWSHNNRSKVLYYAQRRRELTKDLSPEVIQRVYEDNIKKYGTLTCILCFKPIEFGQDSLEHLTPLVRGGNNLYENLSVAHLKCNLQKNRKTLTEWRKYYGEIISK